MRFSYYAIFEYSSEEDIQNGIYPIGIYFPDFLGCVSGADNTEHGLEMAKESLSLHIEAELADKKQLPNPSDMEDLVKYLAPNERLLRITVDL